MATKVQYPLVAGDKGLVEDSASRVPPMLALLAGWLVPGAGHLLLGKWIRAGLLMISILCMFAIGIALQGKVYTPNTGEPLDMLGFAGDLGTGVLYGLARLLGWGQAPMLFALFTSVVFGITQRAEPRMMVRFGALCFALFVGGTVAASWVMWLIKH